MLAPLRDHSVHYPVFFNDLQEENPLAAGLLPAMGNIQAVEARDQTRLLMLTAASAVLGGGVDKLRDFTDPYDDATFTHLANQKGFERE